MSGDPAPPPGRPWRAALIVAGVIAVNVLAYGVLATPTAQHLLDALSGWRYPGAFVLALGASASVLVPVPYNAVILQLAATAPLPWLVALAAAAGSALGETTGWWLGRRGSAVMPTTGRAARVLGLLQRAAGRRWTAFAAIAAFASVPNYVFDLAGLAAGASGVGYRLFLAATFTGRLARFLLFALAGPSLLAAWSRLWA